MKMCQALADLGHQVTLLAPHQPALELPGIDNLYSYYGVRPVFEVVKKPFPKLPGRAWFYAYGCLKLLRELKPDLVYGRYFPAVGLACLRGFPSAYESHEKLWLRGSSVGWLMRRVFDSKQFRQLIVISSALAGFYREAGFAPACGITVAHDAADPQPGADNSETLTQDSSYRMHCGYVGSLFRGRGVELLLDCAERLPDCSFHFIGGSADDIDRIRDERGDLPENAVFHGHLPPPEAAALRSRFDVLLAPYQRSVAVWGGKGDTSSYMSPLKIFEYMATGKAIISSDMPVLREVLNEGNSVLLPGDDVDAWAGAMADLRDDASRRERLGQAALEYFERSHTWLQRAEAVVAACDRGPEPGENADVDAVAS